jgi:MFS family permease
MSDRSVGAAIARAILRFTRWCWRLIRGEVVRRVGGTARARVILIFGLVLALNGADLATVGSIAPQLETGLNITNLQIGLLSSASLVVGAVFTIPVGLFVDRIQRVPLLAVSIVLWSIASLLSAFAGSYSTLLLTRLLLGAVVATAGPAIASLTGDYFPSQERARIYAYILGGEVAGNAVGFIVCGNVASAIDWRAAFVLLAIPGFFLARSLYRTVPEPIRGGQNHLQPGAVDLVQAAAEARAHAHAESHESDREPAEKPLDFAQIAAERLGARPNPALILADDPRTLTLAGSVRYVLSIPTNVMMIISSSLGYFFFSGLSTFALLFVRGHYHVGQAKASLVLALLVGGALVGTLVSGWLSDAIVSRGYLNARVWVPAICYIGAAVLLVPGFLADHLSSAIWFDVAGAALLSAANPPLDAARLDIMPAGLWGRAESVRTTLRSLAQALAPLLFGGLADLLAIIFPKQTGGIFRKQAPIGTVAGAVSPSEARGLEITFLVMLVVLVAGGVALLRARVTYAQDVATAAASHQGSGAPSVASRDSHTLEEDEAHQRRMRFRERRTRRLRRGS